MLLLIRVVRCERADDLSRNGYRLERRARHASEHHVTFCDQTALALLSDLEPKRERFIPEASDISRNFYRIIEHQRLAEVEMNLHPWQPDVESIKDLRVGQAYGAEEFGLGDFEKSEELTVVDDTGAISVGPANVLFDCESFRHCFSNDSRLGS